MARLRDLVAVLLASVLLGACATTPEYARPEFPVPDDWRVPLEGGATRGDADLSAWWKEFQDPQLEHLIGLALEVNLDLKIARARLREARAVRGTIAPELLPKVNANGSFTRSRASENAGFGGGQEGLAGMAAAGAGGGAGGFGGMQNLFQAGFDAHWELDLFGGTQRQIDAATADIAAAEELIHDTQVTLVAEVAREYVEVRGAQRGLAVLARMVEAQTETLGLARSRYEAGLSGALDMKQAEARLAETRSSMPALETAISRGIIRLAILSRQRAEVLFETLGAEITWPAQPPMVPVGMPSDLLRRRPDIREAERQVAAATARVGAAVADLFPKFSLTGRLGGQSDQLTTINLGAARSWSFGPSIQVPLFDRGAIRANIEVQNARQEAAATQYERAILTALEESQGALVAYANEQERLAALSIATEASQTAQDLARELYAGGLADYLHVLQAQTSLLSAEQQRVQSEQAVLQNLIVLYKAVGGGWAAPAV